VFPDNGERFVVPGLLQFLHIIGNVDVTGTGGFARRGNSGRVLHVRFRRRLPERAKKILPKVGEAVVYQLSRAPTNRALGIGREYACRTFQNREVFFCAFSGRDGVQREEEQVGALDAGEAFPTALGGLHLPYVLMDHRKVAEVRVKDEKAPAAHDGCYLVGIARWGREIGLVLRLGLVAPGIGYDVSPAGEYELLHGSLSLSVDQRRKECAAGTTA
jgi:hypothetical protein